MTALDGALALTHGPHGAVGVGHHLYFDVPAGAQVALAEDRRVPERRLGFPLCGSDFVRQVSEFVDDPHATATAAGGGLDEHRKLVGGDGVGVELAQHRYAGGFHEFLGLDLRAH